MKYLGVDFGLRKVGLAISEGTFASPLKTIEVKGLKNAINQICASIEKGKYNKIIVGLPEGRVGQTVLGFVKALKRIGMDVETVDETLSSQRAIAQMIELNIPKEKRQVNDAYSAAIILQNYLDSLKK